MPSTSTGRCGVSLSGAACEPSRRDAAPRSHATHEHVHLLVQAIVHDEVVRHAHAVRLRTRRACSAVNAALASAGRQSPAACAPSSGAPGHSGSCRSRCHSSTPRGAWRPWLSREVPGVLAGKGMLTPPVQLPQTAKGLRSCSGLLELARGAQGGPCSEKSQRACRCWCVMVAVMIK